MNVRTNKGPKTEPCGTLLMIDSSSEKYFSILTCCTRFRWGEAITFCLNPTTSKRRNFGKRIWWSTRSKVLEKYKYVAYAFS